MCIYVITPRNLLDNPNLIDLSMVARGTPTIINDICFNMIVANIAEPCTADHKIAS